jgi:hypothetical protein
MKKCTWCGKEYPDAAVECSIDGKPLAGEDPLTSQVAVPQRARNERLPLDHAAARRIRVVDCDASWQPKLIDLGQVESAFDFNEGYSRPDWKLIREMINKTIPAEKIPDAWTEAAIQWAQRVSADLGEECRVRRSNNFVSVSALRFEAAEQLLMFAEQTLEQIYAVLQGAAWKPANGKRMMFLFAEEDDYYQYVSYFHRDGVHPTSGGCLIHGGYVHIAIPYSGGRRIRQTLAHELMHNCVAHLRLPLWLNEGLAVTFDRTVAQWQRPTLDHDLRDRHFAFWSPLNIQEFWSGTSFGKPGDSNELSYSLAEILVNLLLSESKYFGLFVQHADWNDAGQTAALDILGVDLGSTAATFLGEGNWRPNRKAIVDCWHAVKKQEQPEPQNISKGLVI